MRNKIVALGFIITLLSCKEAQKTSDASGTFEAVETIVSAEANGKILQLSLQEGDELKEGQLVGYIDSTQLHLNKLSLLQNKKTILSAKPDIRVQIESLKKELENALLDQSRIENLVKANVASPKQLDDLNAKVAVLQAKIDAQQNSLQTTTTNINEQSNNVYTQLALLNDQLSKCKIINPVQGTVLTKYAEPKEMAATGKPLYKIANLSTLILRIYITGNQLPTLKLHQQVKVLTDDGKGGFKETNGNISWISDNAEFTPKTIQTKDERANLVYAVKVLVQNDGSYKIGMYGEVKF